MIKGHRIKEFKDIQKFVKRIKYYPRETVQCTEHTFFRLSEKQRKLFTCNSLKRIMFEEIPVLAGIQYNGCYAAFYKHEKQRFIRMIMDIQPSGIQIVTFYIIGKDQLPR